MIFYSIQYEKKVICVLVLYNSNVELLSKVISAILPQVDLLWISDNSIEPLHLPLLMKNFLYYIPKNAR